MSIDDYYTNPAYWQENECQGCGCRFSVSPIPRPDTAIECGGLCGRTWQAGHNAPTTYMPNPLRIVEWPQPED